MSDCDTHSEMTMIFAHPRHRCPWIALAAFVVALSATGGVDACSTMAEGRATCAAPCDCCVAPASDGPAPDAVDAFAAHQRVLPPAAEVCGDSPAGGCACRPGPPEAPEPKPGHRNTGQEETEAGRDLAVGESAHVAPRALPRSIRPPVGPPQGSPLYLRHSRLLI